MGRIVSLTGAALLVLALSAPAAAADDSGPRGSASYSCTLKAGGKAPVTATMSLADVPDSVTPGQTIHLGGTLSLGFTSQTALHTQLLLTSKVGVSSAELSLTATTGEEENVIDAVSVHGDQSSLRLGKPYTLEADVELAGYTVPKDATGDVVIALPSAATVPNTVSRTQAKAAFTAELSQNGLVHDNALACTADRADAVALIARIPVDTASHVDQDEPTAPSDTTAGSGIALPPPVAEPPADPGAAEASTPAPEPPAASAAGATRPVFAAVPPSTRHTGVFIPLWSIALVGLVVPVMSVAFALALRRRLHVMERVARVGGDSRGRSRS